MAWYDYDTSNWGCEGDCLNCSSVETCPGAHGVPDEYHDGHEDDEN